MPAKEKRGQKLTTKTGELGRIPFELRLEIYAHVLCFNKENNAASDLESEPSQHSRNENATALLRTSKTIYSETKKVLFNVNAFDILLYRPESHEVEEVKRLLGLRTKPDYIFIWKHRYMRSAVELYFPGHLIDFSNHEMVREMRHVHVFVGLGLAIRESDIIKSGLDGLTIFTLIVELLIDDVLMKCICLKTLSVEIKSLEERPWNVRKLLDLFCTVRGVKDAQIDVWSTIETFGGTTFIQWQLKEKYKKLLGADMQLPKGSEITDYLRNRDQDDKRDEEDIFEYIELDSEDEEEDEDDDEDEEVESDDTVEIENE